MKPGNGVPTASDRERGSRDDRQLRDIEELVAKLQRVTRQLAFPVRTTEAVPPGKTRQPGESVVPGEMPGEADAD